MAPRLGTTAIMHMRKSVEIKFQKSVLKVDLQKNGLQLRFDTRIVKLKILK